MRLSVQLALILAALFVTPAAGQTNSPPQAEQIARLVRQLDADRYESREQAARALAEIGTTALPDLQKAR